ncbi:ComEC/Rec2 family competence protein [Pseudarthrobacter sp. N5]|uniref:ComEC/Rec2 family competence protein n=1 Tax=Pseudarthrobacter sp. N5 TaxID=3418416 RepID=UPI003CEDBDAB
MRQPSRWQRFVEAAVRPPAVGAGPEPLEPERLEPWVEGQPARAGASPQSLRGHARAAQLGEAGITTSPQPSKRAGAGAGFRIRIRKQLGTLLRPETSASCDAGQTRRRTDLRLAPPALLVWGAAIAGVWLPPTGLVLVCCGLLACSTPLILLILRQRKVSGSAPRSFLTTLAAGLLLAVAAAAHSAVSSSQRHEGPLAGAVSAGASVVAEVEVTGAARELKMAGYGSPSSRWSVPVRVRSIAVSGQVVFGAAELVILGGPDWEHAVPGQMIRTTGKLKQSDAGQTEAGVLSASSPPVVVGDPAAWEVAPEELRGHYLDAAAWLGQDARGLLPGMVTGDTSALDEQLSAAMKTVGMTHLTAVSGANCSLILGALLLAARSLRLPRVPAACFALAGLGFFVLLVGPDASVLRAALMGSIALASLAGGRTGRGLSFLCLAVIGLMLLDPGLAVSFGFLLSVLATLGIVVLGKRLMEWMPSAVPRWVAAGVAVPLSAQLLCGPAIVILQPQFTTYSFLANVVAAPLVAPVTILGTAAVPLVPLAPWLAAPLIAAAGTSAAGVARIARFMSGLPGAALPWPEGVFGLFTMVLCSMLTLLTLWLALRPADTWLFIRAAHAGVARGIDRIPTFQGTNHPGRPRGHSGRPHIRHGLVLPARRGRLGVCNPISWRNQEWPLPRPNATGPRRPTRPPGGM